MPLKNLVVVKHPLIDDYVTRIRDKKTSFIDFRFYVDKIASILAIETAKELKLKRRTVSTPLSDYKGFEINEFVVLVPILRAGLGLIKGFNKIFPDAVISHIGIYRDEKTLEPVQYYFKFPALNSKKRVAAFIIDPMLATGGSADCTIAALKNEGVKKIIVASLVSAPEGIRRLNRKHKDVKIYTCAVDKKLNKHGYIVPGLGDAGDRLFGT
jgi:uracil phosphoribosyltransferase